MWQSARAVGGWVQCCRSTPSYGAAVTEEVGHGPAIGPTQPATRYVGIRLKWVNLSPLFAAPCELGSRLTEPRRAA